MKAIKLKALLTKDYSRIVRRSSGTNKKIMPRVKRIMENIRRNGDKAILSKYQKRYGSDKYKCIQVTRKEMKGAYKEVGRSFIKAIKQMIKNITDVHKVQLPKKLDTVVNPEKGISVWREWRAIERVGLYIPGGKAIYPSSVLMTAIPAQIAGCSEIIICSPPDRRGQIPSPTLVAADMIGINKIYKVGGAEAIGAFAYGTKTIPKVYKIFGAGNSYVTAAKLAAMEEIAIDMPAGPSEIFIIADDSANPTYIAADLLADGEHGEDSACVLLTTSWKVAKETEEEIKKQLKKLLTRDRMNKSLKQYGLIGVVDSLAEAINFTNEYAPEHLEIMTKNADQLVKKITNAGSVFLGDWTTKSSGDYATGANHVLPTGGSAKMYQPLSVEAYGKWMQIQKCTREGLLQIKSTIETIAEVEQLPAHKNATSIRFKK